VDEGEVCLCGPLEFTKANRERLGLEVDRFKTVHLYTSPPFCGIGIGGHEATTITSTILHNDYRRELDVRAGAYNERTRTEEGMRKTQVQKTNRMEQKTPTRVGFGKEGTG